MPSSDLYSHPHTPLVKHLREVASLCGRLSHSKAIAFDRLGIAPETFYAFITTVGLAHDFGKATSYFQAYLASEGGSYRRPPEANHGLLSALFTYYALTKSFKGGVTGVTRYLPFIGYLIVKRHHGNLKDARDEINEVLVKDTVTIIDNQIRSLDGHAVRALYESLAPELCAEEFLTAYRGLIGEIRSERRGFYKWLKTCKMLDVCVLTLLSYSILISADKTTASGLEIERNETALHQDLVAEYRTKRLWDQNDDEIGRLRNDIYHEAMATVDAISLSERILSFTAPTGSGKTLTALAAALRLRQRVFEQAGYYPRIIYSLPFLSIIDQNFAVFEEVLRTGGIERDSSVLLKHHHLGEVFFEVAESEFMEDQAQFLIEGWNSEIVVTTFVQLFHSLFTNRNQALRKFHNIVNSIIILDEVQSIPHKYWKLLDDFLRVLGDCFNTYIILMTATQPLIFNETVSELLPHKDRYFERLNRVDLIPSIAPPTSLDAFKRVVSDAIDEHPTKDFLIVLNTINSAREVYETLKDADRPAPNGEYFYLSTHVTPRQRAERIAAIRTGSKRKVIVSTQLVEAGVDIDVDFAFRDFGPMDCINQVSGRCNRNSRKKGRGTVRVYTLLDERGRPFHTYVYGALLTEKTKKTFADFHDDVATREAIAEPQFLRLITDYFARLKAASSDDAALLLLDEVKNLNFQQVYEKFKLIDEEGYEKVDLFVELDDRASELWNAYVEIRSVEDRFERKRRFLKIKRDFYDYTISVPRDHVSQDLMDYEWLGRIPRGLLDTYYDGDTGFRPSREGLMVL